MKDWKEILANSATSFEELPEFIQDSISKNTLSGVIKKYPMRINSYYMGLIQTSEDPLWKQAVPSVAEINDTVCITDPLGEEDLSPVPNLVHKYPDRALFLITNNCAMFCRFCTRKRKVGKIEMNITKDTINQGITYLKNTPQIRDVLLSGGDPLLLDDYKLDEILSEIHAISHIETIRIGSRVPSTLPMRITPNLIKVLRKYHPLYINTHFNHPRELTPEAIKACNDLADAGIPLGCQTVLLKGVNDDAEILKKLFTSLLQCRVKPYYLFQTDLTKGTNHFRTKTSIGVEIIKKLVGNISGMAIPKLALDAPGGKGKIFLSPNYIIEQGDSLVFTNYLGEMCEYPEVI